MSSRFEITETLLADLHVAVRKPIGDTRGYLERMFCDEDLSIILNQSRIRQINRTLTEAKGTVRGLHYQRPPHQEMKIISCLKGEVFDVAVDVRQGSSTFLDWHGEILSEKNSRTMVIPPGFAHGFQTLTSNCEMLYFHTASFCPEAEAGLDALDEAIGIDWPQNVTARSQRDTGHETITSEFTGVAL